MAIVWLLNKSSSIEGHRVSGLIVVIERITWISLLLESRGITKSIVPRFSISLTVGLWVSFSFTFEVSVWLNELTIIGLNETGSHSIVIGGWISRLMIVVRVTWISSIERGIVESIPRFRFRLGLRFRFTSHKGNKGKNDLWKRKEFRIFSRKIICKMLLFVNKYQQCTCKVITSVMLYLGSIFFTLNVILNIYNIDLIRLFYLPKVSYCLVWFG